VYVKSIELHPTSWGSYCVVCCHVVVKALVMIQKIRDAFSELLEEVPWMDEETKIVAREKVLLRWLSPTGVLLLPGAAGQQAKGAK